MWQSTGPDWTHLSAAIVPHWTLFLYLVAADGDDELHVARHAGHVSDVPADSSGFTSARGIADITMLSDASARSSAAWCSGYYSDRIGRRRAMVTRVLRRSLVVPLWMSAPAPVLIVVGAFLMQFMVQGAWGVIPAHINELSPGTSADSFPGFAYQCGVLCARRASRTSSRSSASASATPMPWGVLVAIVFVIGFVVILLGPEAHGITFRKSKA